MIPSRLNHWICSCLLLQLLFQNVLVQGFSIFKQNQRPYLPFQINQDDSFCCNTKQKMSNFPFDNIDNSIPIITSQKKINQIQERLERLHHEEIQRGIDIFDSEMKDNSHNQKSWIDDDFISYDVGIGNAGPDECHMKNANKVYATTKPVFTKKECEQLISEARQSIFKTLSNEQETSTKTITNSALGEAMVSNLPQALQWLKDAMKTTLFPLLESRFGVSDLTLNDALIIGYGCFHQSSNYTQPVKSQPIHRDASLISLNIALSPKQSYDPKGGGTYFEGVSVNVHHSKNKNGQGAIQIEQGHVICHSSGAMHAGNGIQHGERWVLVLFCLAKSIPQIARRCHSEGIAFKMKGQYDEAIATFEAGIQIAPKDHLLPLSLGSIYAIRSNGKDEQWTTSQSYLQKAASLYTIDPSPLLALGKTYLEQRNAYKAYGCFDLILSRIQNLDLLENAWIPLKSAAYEARIYSGQCAVICAEEEAMGMTMPSTNEMSNHDSKLPFTIHVLPQAIQQLIIAIDLNPNDERLHALLSRANELLEKARAIA